MGSSGVPVKEEGNEGCCLCLSFRMKSPAVDGREPGESNGDSFVGLVDGELGEDFEERLSGVTDGGSGGAVVVLVPPPPPPPPPRKRRTPFMVN